MKIKLISNDPWSPALEFILEKFPAVIGCHGEADAVVENRWMRWLNESAT